MSGQGKPVRDFVIEEERHTTQLPVQITFRHMAPSEAIEAAIRERAVKLEKVHPHIMSCRVVVENIAAHKHQGRLYSLHIDLKVPGHEFAITRDRNEDIFVALRDAFDRLRANGGLSSAR